MISPYGLFGEEFSLFPPISCSRRFSLSSQTVFLEISHSQTTITFQPSARSCSCTFRSLAIFLSNFFCQNSRFEAGVVAYLQPGCLCQKQPFIKITVRYFGSTISGFPGYRLSFLRDLYPFENRYFLTISSGLVSFPRICDILKCRCSFVKMSDTGITSVCHTSLNIFLKISCVITSSSCFAVFSDSISAPSSMLPC